LRLYLSEIFIQRLQIGRSEICEDLSKMSRLYEKSASSETSLFNLCKNVQISVPICGKRAGGAGCRIRLPAEERAASSASSGVTLIQRSSIAGAIVY